ncbi:hypothetical protein PVAP13_6KG125070 [Panicum virgatum]|uniref:Uncharacterized protein n=1 Tax=Panicum virgatum TaxID=38727 RepID=A0A8T0RAS7_PANVG|nr:hypothetical protein PVAP13_6KG125070 [Panicum virgatum]
MGPLKTVLSLSLRLHSSHRILPTRSCVPPPPNPYPHLSLTHAAAFPFTRSASPPTPTRASSLTRSASSLTRSTASPTPTRASSLTSPAASHPRIRPAASYRRCRPPPTLLPLFVPNPTSTFFSHGGGFDFFSERMLQ